MKIRRDKRRSGRGSALRGARARSGPGVPPESGKNRMNQFGRIIEKVGYRSLTGIPEVGLVGPEQPLRQPSTVLECPRSSRWRGASRAGRRARAPSPATFPGAPSVFPKRSGRRAGPRLAFSSWSRSSRSSISAFSFLRASRIFVASRNRPAKRLPRLLRFARHRRPSDLSLLSPLFRNFASPRCARSVENESESRPTKGIYLDARSPVRVIRRGELPRLTGVAIIKAKAKERKKLKEKRKSRGRSSSGTAPSSPRSRPPPSSGARCDG